MATDSVRIELDRLETLYDAGTTRVYRGLRDAEGRPWVLKGLRVDYPSEAAIEALRREEEIIAELDVPGVIRTAGWVESGGLVGIVLEDIGGASLDALRRARPFSVLEVLEIGIALAETLARVHQRGFIHKDVNPSNLIFDPVNHSLRLIDFGIASRVSRQRVEARPPNRLEGTLRYIAPEQTGRVNRCVDQRSDLYSFGATLYFLLTGTPVFDLPDARELVHAHIARRPTPPSSFDAEVPPMLDAIVSRLLEKNAEDRYQSALGVKHDLERCKHSLLRGEVEVRFDLALDDVVDRLRLPEKLYGREKEIAALESAFRDVAEGAVTLMLVRGYSGVGKTSLVRELAGSLAERNARFLGGKFDQFQRNVPYASLIEAFRSFTREMSAEPPEVVHAFAEHVMAAVAPNGRVLIDVIPELSALLGPQPEVAELPAGEAENRLNVVLVRFLRSLASPEHPVVLFLDDLQWADVPTLRLLGRLAQDKDASHLLLLGAYRDNETDATHPLMDTLRRLEATGTHVREVALGPLSVEDVNGMVAEALRTDEAEVRALAALCFEKTAGNPFFLNRFLEGLYEEQLVVFDVERARWTVRLDEIRARNITDNVVEFMTGKLRQLDDVTQRSLFLAAVVGPTFGIGAVSMLLSESPEDTYRALRPALEEGLILELGDRTRGAEFTFLHDRVQQAAYELGDEGTRRAAHVALGRHLLAQRREDDADDHLFEIVTHLNHGADQLVAQAERNELAALDIEASQRAMAAAAYGAAAEFADVASRLLPAQARDQAPDLALRIDLVGAAAAFLTGRYEDMDRRIDSVLRHAKNPLDAIRAYEIRVDARNAKHDLRGAVETNLAALRTLGIELPAQPGQLDVLRELARTKLLLARRSVDSLRALPTCHDASVIAALDILMALIGPAYYAAPNLVPLIAFESVKLALRHGLTPASATGFSVYGLVLCTLSDFAGAYQFGQLAMSVAGRFGRHRQSHRARHLYNTHVRFWTDPWRESLTPLAENHLDAYADGDFEYAAFSGFMYCAISASVGISLRRVAEEMDRYASAIADMQQGTSGKTLAIMHQATLNLIGRGNRIPYELCGDRYDERVDLDKLLAENDSANLFVLHSQKCALAYLFRRPDLVLASAERNAPFESGAASTVFIPIALFYETLAIIATLDSLGLADKARAHARIFSHLRRLRSFAKASPGNIAHRIEMIEAELARVQGREERAVLHYERAITKAAAGEWHQDVALAKELSGRFHLGLGNTTLGRSYLREARFAYQQWGAHAKVSQLDEEFPFLAPMPGGASGELGSTVITSVDLGESLDLSAVLEVSRTISEEIVRGKLLAKLLGFALESGGAERVALIQLENGRATVEAQADVHSGGIQVELSIPLEDATSLAKSIVMHVLREGRSVVLGNAAVQGDFRRDSYVRERRPRSILCVPIVHQGVIRGALYLENNITAEAFTEARVQLLAMLGAQAAISLENARLYQELDAKVRERTLQLEARNDFIRSAFGRYLSNEIAEELLERPAGLKLGGAERVVTVLMSDLRGFSSLVEELTPEQVITLLNHYLGVMTEVILEHGGTIDEFIGDAILVIFGAPVHHEDHAARAIACAIDMQLAMARVNEGNASLGLPELEMGAGVHTGSVVVGNIGSRRRAKYGIVGTTVNAASRIEAYTTGGQILVSAEAERASGLELRIERAFELRAKGIRTPLSVRDVRGIVGGPTLPERHHEVRTLAEPLRVGLAVSDGRGGFGEEFEAWLVGIGSEEVRLRCERVLADGAELRVVVPVDGGGPAAVLEGQASVTDLAGELAVRTSQMPRAVRVSLGREVVGST